MASFVLQGLIETTKQYIEQQKSGFPSTCQRRATETPTPPKKKTFSQNTATFGMSKIDIVWPVWLFFLLLLRFYVSSKNGPCTNPIPHVSFTTPFQFPQQLRPYPVVVKLNPLTSKYSSALYVNTYLSLYPTPLAVNIMTVLCLYQSKRCLYSRPIVIAICLPNGRAGSPRRLKPGIFLRPTHLARENALVR